MARPGPNVASYGPRRSDLEKQKFKEKNEEEKLESIHTMKSPTGFSGFTFARLSASTWWTSVLITADESVFWLLFFFQRFRDLQMWAEPNRGSRVHNRKVSAWSQFENKRRVRHWQSVRLF